MIASQIWKVAPLRIKVIFWISVLKLKEDKQTYFRCFPEQEKHIQKDTIRHHHFIDRAKRQNSLHDSITVFGNEESNKMQSIKSAVKRLQLDWANPATVKEVTVHVLGTNM